MRETSSQGSDSEKESSRFFPPEMIFHGTHLPGLGVTVKPWHPICLNEGELIAWKCPLKQRFTSGEVPGRAAATCSWFFWSLGFWLIHDTYFHLILESNIPFNFIPGLLFFFLWKNKLHSRGRFYRRQMNLLGDERAGKLKIPANFLEKWELRRWCHGSGLASVFCVTLDKPFNLYGSPFYSRGYKTHLLIHSLIQNGKTDLKVFCNL